MVTVGDIVRITSASLRVDYVGLRCRVVFVTGYNVKLKPLTPRPDGHGMSEFYWPKGKVEVCRTRFDMNGANIRLASDNAYQFEMLINTLIRRRQELYSVEEFAKHLGVKKKWVRKFESQCDISLWNLKFYALGVGARMSIGLESL